MINIMGVDVVALIVKVFFVVITILYAVFSFMVVRQVSLMNETFSSPLNKLFAFLSWVHFFVAVLAILIVFIVL